MDFKSLTPEKILQIRANLHKLTPSKQETVLKILRELQKREASSRAQLNFMEFVKAVWPGFILGRHHKIMAEKFEAVARGEIKRLAISLPPRHSKSELASYLLPAWFLGNFPEKKIMQASHTAELAVNFGRKVRNLVDSEVYKDIYPDVRLQTDSKAAGRWGTNKGGVYNALGVGAGAAGMGADIFIIDDPHNEQDIINGNTDVFDKAWEWYQSGPRQRLQPGGGIIVVHCIAEGERVLLADGRWIPIQDITVGMQVASYKEGKLIPATVTATAPQGPDNILKIGTQTSELKCNKDHPLLVVRGGADISPKTQADVRRAQSWGTEWVKAGDLKVGDMVVMAKSLTTSTGYRPMRYNSRTQMTQEDYWLFGMLFGDGWLVNNGKRGRVGLCIAMSKYPELNARIVSAVKNCFGVELKQTKFGYWRCDNTDLANWLFDKGFDSGAKTKRIPEWVFRLRKCDKRQFILGFAEADGYQRNKNVETYTIGINNREMLDDLRLLARTCGVRVSKIYHEAFTTQPPNSPTPVQGNTYRARFQFKQNKSELNARYRGQSSNGTQYVRFERIEKIDHVGIAPVYDITVEGTESFVCEGFVVHNTRWSKKDLIGRLLDYAAKNPDADQWEYIEFPAIFNEGEPNEQSLWPEFWPLKELQQIRNTLAPHLWAAQYMQNPTTAEGALIKKEWWQHWPEEDPPPCEYTIMSLDAAQEAHNRADYNAVTMWGVFYRENDDGIPVANIILLNAWKQRMEFPELKNTMIEEYNTWEPDTFIVEKKSNGAALYQELRATGIPVSEFTPSKGNDKIARVNAVATLFESGLVWAPKDRRWAQEVIEECSDFPNGEHDDYVDSCTQALRRFRDGGFIRLPTDYDDEVREFKGHGKRYYAI